MTTISAAVPAVQLPPPASAGSASSPSPTKAATPSDTVAISAPAATASAPPAEKRVNRLLDEIKTHNDIADVWTHIDWGGVEKQIGKAETEKVQHAHEAWMSYSTARIGIDLGGSGISVQPDTTTKGPHGDAVSGLLSVNNFTFKSDGSTYAMSAGKDGTLVGIKDGQAWKTWQITPNHAGKVNDGAQAALSTLQGLLSPSKSGSFPLVQISA